MTQELSAEIAPLRDARPGTPSPATRVVVTLVLSGVVTSLVQSIVAPILPVVMRSTGTSFTSASWLLTSTLLAGAVATPIFSRLGDQRGRKKMLVVCLVLLAIGSLVCSVSNVLPILIGARALQGAGMAVVPLGLGILRTVQPPSHTIRSAAILSGSMGVGGAFGVPFAGLIVEVTSWHVMFACIAGLAIAAIVCTLVIVPSDVAGTGERIDVVGAAGISLGLIVLLTAITNGSSLGWASPAIVGSFSGAAAILLGVGAYELKAKSPLIDLRLNRRRSILMINLSALLVGFGFYVNTLVTSLLVQEPKSTGYGLGLPLALTGLTLIPGGLGVVTMSPVSARLSVRTSPKFSLIVGVTIMILGYVFRFAFPTGLATIVIGAAIISVGLGIAYGAYPALVLREVDRADTAAVNGINTLSRLLGSTVCGAVIAVLLATLTVDVGGHEYPTLGAYRLIFLLAACVCAVGLFFACLIRPAGSQAAA